MSAAAQALGLSAAQRQVAAAAEAVLLAGGLPPALVAGALVNAYAESRLNPRAAGDKGRSVGIWQLHEKWAGRGMSVADRQDVAKATRRILDVYRGSQGKAVRAAVASGEQSIGRLAYLWSLHIERPSGKEVEARRRQALALTFWPLGLAAAASSAPSSASAPSETPQLPSTPPRRSYTRPLLGVAGLLLLLLLVRRRRLAAAP